MCIITGPSSLFDSSSHYCSGLSGFVVCFFSDLLFLSLCLPPPRILLVHPSVTQQLFSFSFLLSTFPCIVTYTSSSFWICLITSSTLPSFRLTSIGVTLASSTLTNIWTIFLCLLFLVTTVQPVTSFLTCLRSSSSASLPSSFFPLSPFLTDSLSSRRFSPSSLCPLFSLSFSFLLPFSPFFLSLLSC